MRSLVRRGTAARRIGLESGPDDVSLTTGGARNVVLGLAWRNEDGRSLDAAAREGLNVLEPTAAGEA